MAQDNWQPMNNNTGTALKQRLDSAVRNYARRSRLWNLPMFNLQELPESERFYIWTWETDEHGTLVWCSPDVTHLTGRTPDELEGRPAFEDMLDAHSLAKLTELLKAGKPFRDFILEGAARDGKGLQIAFSGHPVPPGTGPAGFFGTANLIRRPDTLQDGHPRASTVPGKETHALYPRYSTSGGFTLDEDGFNTIAGSLEEAPVEPVIKDGVLHLPIQSGSTILGVLELERSPDEQGWTEEEVELLHNLGAQLASAVQDARAYELTLKALEEMQEADHLKSQLLANMSHELRTPLNSIIGFSSVILKGIDGPINETQEQDVQQIHNAGQHLLGLINNVLDLSKIEADKMQLTLNRIDLHSIIHEVVEIADALIKQKPVELLVDIPDNIPMIEADSTRVRQVLLNLISNAVKFTDNGQIGIFVRALPTEAVEEILISVVDTGIGITPEDQLKLFQPFSQIQDTASRPGSGTGLGLSICRHLVELHRGRIWVESTPGEGSTFTFTLPINQKEVSDTPQTAQLLVLAHNPETTSRLQKLLPQYRLESSRFEMLAADSEITSETPLLLAEFPFQEQHLWNMLQILSKSSQMRPVQFTALGSREGLILPPVRLAPLELSRDQAAVLDVLFRPSSQQQQSRLIVVDAAESTRKQMQAISAGSKTVINYYEDARSALEEIRRNPPTALLFNLFMPGADGFRILETFRAEQLHTEFECIILIPESPAGHEGRQFLRYIQHLNDNNAVPLQAIQKSIQQSVRKYTSA